MRTMLEFRRLELAIVGNIVVTPHTHATWRGSKLHVLPSYILVVVNQANQKPRERSIPTEAVQKTRAMITVATYFHYPIWK